VDEMDGCSRKCRKSGEHTLVYGECEHGAAPDPVLLVSMTYQYTAEDGYPAIGMHTYTDQELADLILPELYPEGGWPWEPFNEAFAKALALNAARAIIYRNKEAGP
jgi:hypothetical protein